jgi:hypothetical protein
MMPEAIEKASYNVEKSPKMHTKTPKRTWSKEIEPYDNATEIINPPLRK